MAQGGRRVGRVQYLIIGARIQHGYSAALGVQPASRVTARAARRIAGAATITIGAITSHEMSQLRSHVAMKASAAVADRLAMSVATPDVSPDCRMANTKWL